MSRQPVPSPAPAVGQVGAKQGQDRGRGRVLSARSLSATWVPVHAGSGRGEQNSHGGRRPPQEGEDSGPCKMGG